MKKVNRIFAFLLALLTLFCFVACGESGTPIVRDDVKREICKIPTNEETLLETVNACKRYESSYLPDRRVEQIGTFCASDCAVVVRRLTFSEGKDTVTAYVADVYIDNMTQFYGYVCRDENGKLSNKPAADVIAETGALLLVNADYLSARRWGLYVRNGVKVRSGSTDGVDVCLIGKDGKMRTVNGDTFDTDAAMKDKNLCHIFSFGPSLLNADGTPRDEDAQFHITDRYSKWNNYESTVGFPVPNPRTAFGQAEDGHFLFVTVDGRMKGFSRGVTFPELSHILYEEGAIVAYNMDGGGSEILCFKGVEYTKQYSEDAKRIPSDYVVILSDNYQGETP